MAATFQEGGGESGGCMHSGWCVYLRYPLVYARHRQLTLVLEGVFDELGVGERRFLRPACFAVVGSHVPRAGGQALGGSGVVHIDWQRIKYTKAGENGRERERKKKRNKLKSS